MLDTHYVIVEFRKTRSDFVIVGPYESMLKAVTGVVSRRINRTTVSSIYRTFTDATSPMKPKVTATGRPRSTAGLIVIGDEILKGTTRDSNAHFLCRRLHSLGVVVKKVSVVGDSVEDISEEVRMFSSLFDMVLTTGGVGPTHDDMTFTGLALAFNDELYLSEEIVHAIKSFLPTVKSRTNSPKGTTVRVPTPPTQSSSEGEETKEDTVENGGRTPKKRNNSFIAKLATIPRTSTLIWGRSVSTGERSPFPVIKIRNVIAFPGVPQFCERSFHEIQEQLFPPSEVERPFSSVLFSTRSEFAFSHLLSEVAKQFAESVEIGSYPEIGNSYFSTKLTIESESREEGSKAVEALNNVLCDHLVVFDAHPTRDTVGKLERLRGRMLQRGGAEFVARLDEAVRVVETIVDEYPMDQIGLSFNGGKDCTVLLHLLRIVVDKKFGPSTPLSGFHIMCEDQFPEMSTFIIDVAKKYRINMVEYPGPLKEGLSLLKKERPSTVAVLMGSRSSDPKGKYMKSHIEWSDADWPRVLRVCPILHWSYSDVWSFLRGLCIPYCELYDQGYTSLGGRASTERNEALKIVDERNGESRYLPAYRLEDDGLERHGRPQASL